MRDAQRSGIMAPVSRPSSGAPPGHPDVSARVERLVAFAEQRWELLAAAERTIGTDPDEPPSPTDPVGPLQRARELRDHTRSYLLPRARDLDAPLLVLLLGPTGSGTSSLMNALVGNPVSRTGVLRPTTRDAVVVGVPGDVARLLEGGALASVPRQRLEVHHDGARPGVVIVDAPDVDSVAHEDRALADALLEAADLCFFVTTATRYADRVPWDVLARADERRLPLVVVVNRMPPGDDADVVLEHVREMLAATSLDVRDVLSVAEGALSPSGTALRRTAVAPVRARIVELSRDRHARRALAEEALAGALEGLVPLCVAVATDLDREAASAEALLEQATDDHAEQSRLLFARLFSGTALREEVVRQWHSFVGADQVTRLFSSGVGRARGTLLALLRGAPKAPVTFVQQGASEDIAALVVDHAAEAARRTAVRWSSDPRGAALVAAEPGLWSASPGLEARAREIIERWFDSVAADVAHVGSDKRTVARTAALGVNAGSVTLMLATFAHTGGLTGAEAGIAAATAYLNQKLLNALFGEAAVQEMIERARERLRTAITALLDAERVRFESLAGDEDALRRLAADLRAAAA
jgi:hypothetical protein